MDKKKEMITRLIMILLGSLLCALSINIFIIPHKLLGGGVSGLAIIAQYLTGLPSGYLILLLNIPIFIFGLKFVDKDFVIYSLFGMVSLSVLMILTVNINHVIKVDNLLLSCIYGGVIGGAGGGLVLRNRASLGGTDIISVIIKKKFGMNIANASLAMNLVVVSLGAFFTSFELALYTLISMYISSYAVNRVIEGFDRQKLLFIVTDKEKEVSQSIMSGLGRGVTFLNGEGAYTGESKKVIYCIVTSSQLVKTMKIINDIDENSFISLVNTSEVHGKGFKRPAL